MPAMLVNLAWKRSGQLTVGKIELDIARLDARMNPVVAEWRPVTRQHGGVSKGRVWRGNADAVWMRMDGKLSNWRQDEESLHGRASLDEQLRELANTSVQQYRPDGIAIHGYEYELRKGTHRTYEGEADIVARGGAKALADARWSASRYAVMDGALWRKHPGPLFKAYHGEFRKLILAPLHADYRGYERFHRAVDLPALAASRPDVDMAISERLVVHDPKPLAAYDVDGFNLESLLINLRDMVGSGRVREMTPAGMRAYAGLVRVESIADDGIPRDVANSGWPYDDRACEFPFRPEVVPLLRQVYENCFSKGLHKSVRPGVEENLQCLEARHARDASPDLSEDDREALAGLAP